MQSARPASPERAILAPRNSAPRTPCRVSTRGDCPSRKDYARSLTSFLTLLLDSRRCPVFQSCPCAMPHGLVTAFDRSISQKYRLRDLRPLL